MLFPPVLTPADGVVGDDDDEDLLPGLLEQAALFTELEKARAEEAKTACPTPPRGRPRARAKAQSPRQSSSPNPSPLSPRTHPPGPGSVVLDGKVTGDQFLCYSVEEKQGKLVVQETANEELFTTAENRLDPDKSSLSLSLLLDEVMEATRTATFDPCPAEVRALLKDPEGKVQHVQCERDCTRVKHPKRWASCEALLFKKVPGKQERYCRKVADGEVIHGRGYVLYVGFETSKPIPLLMDRQALAKGTVEVDWKLVCDMQKQDDMQKAIFKEFKSMETYGIYEICVGEGDLPAIPSRLVLAYKTLPDGSIAKCKCRFVVRGFEDHRDSCKVDMPTASAEMKKIALAFMQMNSWCPMSLDFTCAFLQGVPFGPEEPPVYLKPPKSTYGCEIFPPDCRLRLRKCLYGLKDAPRRWFLSLKNRLEKAGFRALDADGAVYVLELDEKGEPITRQPLGAKKFPRATDCEIEDPGYVPEPPKGTIHGIISIHVDDVLFGGSPEFSKFWRSVVDSLDHDEGQQTLQNPAGVMFTGILHKTSADLCTHLNMDHYTSKLTPIPVENDLSEDTPYEDISAFRAAFGKLSYCVFQGLRADELFRCAQLAKRRNAPTVGNVRELNKVFLALKGRPLSVKIPKFKTRKWRVVTYVDASFTRLHRTSGAVFFVAEDNAEEPGMLRSFPVGWTSSLQTGTAHSSMSAETKATFSSMKIVYYLQNVLVELGVSGDSAVTICTDAHAVVRHADTYNRRNDKSLIQMFQKLRKETELGKIKIFHVSGVSNPSDCLTKAQGLVNVLVTAFEKGQIRLPPTAVSYREPATSAALYAMCAVPGYAFTYDFAGDP